MLVCVAGLPSLLPQPLVDSAGSVKVAKGLTAISKIISFWGDSVAQSMECPTSAQVTISQSVSLSPMSGSALTAQSLEPASDSVSPSLPASPGPVLSRTRSQ